LPPNAVACPECGSDDQTGWSEGAQSDGLDLPEESFDYEDFVKREFESTRRVPQGIHWFWWLVALALVAAFALFLFHK
jgi:hypothetical protein